MNTAKTTIRAQVGASRARTGFTLVELLTVIAIIMLLIGILVPTLSKARDQAKKGATKSTFRALSDGLEMFRNENPEESQGGDGYPLSTVRDDPTESSEQWLYGAQWLVRYLVGKNLDGYIPRRLVPRQALDNTKDLEFWEQKDWYSRNKTSVNEFAPLQRVGPYIPADSIKTDLLENLEGAPYSGEGEGAGGTGGGGIDEVEAGSMCLTEPVFLDNWDWPILYYAANTRLLAAQADAPLAGLGYPDAEDPPRGIYNFADNGLFTGTYVKGELVVHGPWTFNEDAHNMFEYGDYPDDVPDPNSIAQNPNTFPYYILNKDTYETSQQRTAHPARRDSFILISAGKDGAFGTEDDVTNF